MLPSQDPNGYGMPYPYGMPNSFFGQIPRQQAPQQQAPPQVPPQQQRAPPQQQRAPPQQLPPQQAEGDMYPQMPPNVYFPPMQSATARMAASMADMVAILRQMVNHNFVEQRLQMTRIENVVQLMFAMLVPIHNAFNPGVVFVPSQSPQPQQQAGPQQAASQQAGPQQVPPQQAASQQAGPQQRAPPQQAASQQAPPPQQAGPQQAPSRLQSASQSSVAQGLLQSPQAPSSGTRPRSLSDGSQPIASTPTVSPQLNALGVPTLTITGATDGNNPQTNQGLANLIRNIQFQQQFVSSLGAFSLLPPPNPQNQLSTNQVLPPLNQQSNLQNQPPANQRSNPQNQPPQNQQMEE